MILESAHRTYFNETPKCQAKGDADRRGDRAMIACHAVAKFIAPSSSAERYISTSIFDDHELQG